MAVLLYNHQRLRLGRRNIRTFLCRCAGKVEVLTETKNANSIGPVSSRKIFFLHLEYHPNDIPRKKVRELFSETCVPLFTREIKDGGIEIKRIIVAYSRPRNLRDLLQKAKVYQAKGGEVSTYFRV